MKTIVSGLSRFVSAQETTKSSDVDVVLDKALGAFNREPTVGDCKEDPEFESVSSSSPTLGAPAFGNGKRLLGESPVVGLEGLSCDGAKTGTNCKGGAGIKRDGGSTVVGNSGATSGEKAGKDDGIDLVAVGSDVICKGAEEGSCDDVMDLVGEFVGLSDETAGDFDGMIIFGVVVSEVFCDSVKGDFACDDGMNVGGEST
jgi:hypothetical protein